MKKKKKTLDLLNDPCKLDFWIWRKKKFKKLIIKKFKKKKKKFKKIK